MLAIYRTYDSLIHALQVSSVRDLMAVREESRRYLRKDRGSQIAGC
jgi:hypothetical protein